MRLQKDIINAFRTNGWNLYPTSGNYDGDLFIISDTDAAEELEPFKNYAILPAVPEPRDRYSVMGAAYYLALTGVHPFNIHGIPFHTVYFEDNDVTIKHKNLQISFDCEYFLETVAKNYLCHVAVFIVLQGNTQGTWRTMVLLYWSSVA